MAIAQRWPVEDHTPARTESASPRVLIADDQPDVLEALRLLLKGEGYRIESAGSPAAILEAIDGDEFDAVLMDLKLLDAPIGVSTVATQEFLPPAQR